jgi:hypothetical protein
MSLSNLVDDDATEVILIVLRDDFDHGVTRCKSFRYVPSMSSGQPRGLDIGDGEELAARVNFLSTYV